MGTKFLVRMMKVFWNYRVGLVIQFYEYSKITVLHTYSASKKGDGCGSRTHIVNKEEKKTNYKGMLSNGKLVWRASGQK
jgi:hypothetical protein